MDEETTPDWLHLGDEEAVVWESRPHPVEMGARFSIGLAVALAGLILTAWGADGGLSVLTAIGLLAVIGGAVVSIVQYLFWTNTRYVITSSELYEKQGVLSQHVTQFRLDRIQTTSLSQSTLGRMLGYGDLTVYTAGSGESELTFRRVPRPHEASTVLSQQLDGTETPSRTP
ncbi:PH domain-containing protein [Natrialbaceae archaeon A-gly3]